MVAELQLLYADTNTSAILYIMIKELVCAQNILRSNIQLTEVLLEFRPEIVGHVKKKSPRHIVVRVSCSRGVKRTAAEEHVVKREKGKSLDRKEISRSLVSFFSRVSRPRNSLMEPE